MKAPLHPAQSARLDALHGYDILDTPREKDFDDIVQLASAICETPISVITLVAQDRQWFKSEVGLGVDETPIDSSICAHAIVEPGLTEIEDTTADGRTGDNPLVTGDMGLRFYAGAVLETPEGLPLGTLCVLDYKPRQLNAMQKQALSVLARQVMIQLELRKALNHARLLRREVDHRVKNSLQSLSSLVGLQKRLLKTDEAVEAVDNIKLRLEAIATLHHLLYRTDAGSKVDLAGYVATIVDFLAKSAPPKVELALDLAPNLVIDPVIVTPQQAVSVGTLLNEFVSNAYKHGFPGGKEGRVVVDLARDGSEGIRVRCRDNGVGLQAKPAASGKGLGIQIAEVACAELHTSLEIAAPIVGFDVGFSFVPQIPSEP